MRKYVTPATRRGLPHSWCGSLSRTVSRAGSFPQAGLIVALLVFALSPAMAQDSLVSFQSSWRFTRGTNEASSPVTAWRNLTFNDSGSRWSSAAAPFHFGESLSIGTQLTDMRNVYTCVFLRKTFAVTNVADINAFILDVNYDDGFIAWVNGTEVARALVTNTTFSSSASGSHEAGTVVSFTNLFPAYLVNGSNILAIQAFNVQASNSDFRIDAAARVTRDGTRPVISGLNPASGSSVSALSTVTVTFSEPVFGVDASDLLINDLPATGIEGSPGTDTRVFSFSQPTPGQVSLGWVEAHGITDASGNPFDSEAASASWFYNLIDTTGPRLVTRAPVAGAQVNRLGRIQVLFDEPVTGVTAGDLLVNQVPATNVVGSELGPYEFSFPEPAPGVVSLSWASGHGIRDLSPAANVFVGSGWNLNLNSVATPGDLVISEFLAENSATNHLLDVDEDGELQDWIEIQNRGLAAVDLAGWALTDDRDVPNKWIFPSAVLNPGQFLLVYASEKDRRVSGSRLHTNFKLNPFGEYLALLSPEFPPWAATEFTNQYPEQRKDYSFGLDSTNGWRYFAVPTPEAANGDSPVLGITPPPHFTVTRGFFDAPFNLLLTTPIPGATIYYTLDGSEPGQASGLVYSGPINISRTTCVRAAAFGPNLLPSRVATHTYIYLDQVAEQSANPAGFPSIWGVNSAFTAYGGLVPADYEMDLDPLRVDPNDPFSAIDAEKLERFKQGMRELPSVSIVMNVDDMFGTNSLHWKATQKTPIVERPCSVEMILPDGSTAFAADVGIRMHGNASREPPKNPKHGFKLKFKGDFGESSLKYRLFEDSAAQDYDDILLRADFNSSWRHWSDTASQGLGAFQRTRATRTRYAWAQESMRILGHVSPHNRYCHLFINGLYWGTYDFSEQPTEKFAQNHVSSAAGHDIYEQGALREGTSTAYNAMLGISNLQIPANYELMKQYLDVPQHIDYMLFHFLIGHQDWGNVKNWYAIRPRAPAPLGRFRYVPWDQECILLNDNINRVTSTDVPSGLHTKLDDNPQYRLDFADRVHKHMIAPDGVLNPAANIARWQKWQALLDKPIVAESMRWGDYRRDVHPSSEGVYQLYTRENHWLAENDRLVNSYFVGRNATVLSQLRAAGLYPALDAPEYREGTAFGAILGTCAVPAGFAVAITAPAGTIYYTTNGADPRVAYSGDLSPEALLYTSPVVLAQTVTLKTRALNGATWTALNEATFSVGELGVPLRFSEIMYNPIGGDAYEFVEVQNVGTVPLDISGFSFRGVDFIFPPASILQPGAVFVVASSANTNAFATRYPGVAVAGFYEGSLANAGERIAIVDRNENPVVAVFFDDEAGWPAAADGAGYSLENTNPRGDPQAPANWRASAGINGTPGFPPSTGGATSPVLLNEIMAFNVSAVANGGAFPDWIELRNTSATNVNLANWSLSDDSDPRKFVFPAGTIITNGGYLVVWCDSATGSPGLHAGFNLDNDGETVSLFDPASNRVDALTYGIQVPNCSVGRMGGDWKLNLATPASANVAAATAAASNLAINEWLAASGAGSADWIELFNRSASAPVELRGLYLAASNSVQQIRSLSFVAPRGYLQMRADQDPGAAHINLELPAEGGAIALYNDAAVLLESVSYGQQQGGVSEGRLPDGAANIQAFPGTTSPAAANYIMTYTGPVLNEILAINGRATVSPWGNYADWLEIYNPGVASFSLAGMGLGDSLDPAKRWVFPAGTSIGAGGYLVVWCDASRAPSTLTGPVLNTGFSLSGSSGMVVLFNTNSQPVDSVSYGFQITDLSIGRAAGGWALLANPTFKQANSIAASLGSRASLRINEWMANPASGDDWIEVFNSDSVPVDLGGLYLTDDPSTAGIYKSPIPSLSYVSGRSWAMWQADDAAAKGANHAAFSLDSQGETIRLYDTNLALLDALDFGVQPAGVSEGRLPDGESALVQFPVSASPEASNYLPLTNVVINEVLSHTDAPLEDAIELYNVSPVAVNLGGWYLSDSQSDPKRFRIPDNTMIPGRGYRVFYQYQFGSADGEQDNPPKFSLNSARGDAVYLSEADAFDNLTGYRAGVKFGAAANGVSLGRHPTSVGEDFVPLRSRSFGVDNPATVDGFRAGTGLTNALPLVGPVVISEIMYHPGGQGTNALENPDLEYVELHNTAATNAPLYDPFHTTNRWRLAGGIDFEFPANTTIPVGGCLVVVPFDPLTNASARAAFEARYGFGIPMVGPFSGKLDNAGESIELLRPDPPQTAPHPDAGFVPYLLVERISFTDTNPWPAAADGLGSSITRISTADYGNDPVNWTAAAPSPGSVGGVADSDSDGMPDWWEDAYGTLKNTPDADADPDGDGLTNMQEYLAGTLPQNAASNLRLSVASGAGFVLLQFTAASNKTYTVQHKDSPSAQTWLRLRDIEARGSNWQSEITDPIGTANRFYRVVTPKLP